MRLTKRIMVTVVCDFYVTTLCSTRCGFLTKMEGDSYHQCTLYNQVIGSDRQRCLHCLQEFGTEDEAAVKELDIKFDFGLDG